MGKASKAMIGDLVAANHILFNEGILDAYGHVSARDPENPERFFLARHMAPGIVRRRDILTFDLDGNVQDGDGAKLYTELFIHAAMYKARSDVNGVVHSHSHAIIPFGATKATLRAIWASGAFLALGVAKFDTRDRFGDTDLMIRNPELGLALAEAMGNNVVTLMRGHGATVVGTSLRESVFRAIYLDVNARMQSEALRLDDNPVYITEGEARLLTAHLQADPTYKRPWEFWTTAEKDRPSMDD